MHELVSPSKQLQAAVGISPLTFVLAGEVYPDLGSLITESWAKFVDF